MKELYIEINEIKNINKSQISITLNLGINGINGKN